MSTPEPQDRPDMEPAPAPFFIVGAQRSGTTMFRLMLNAHPGLAVPFETDFVSVYEHLEGNRFADPEARAKAVESWAREPLTKKARLLDNPARFVNLQDIDSFDALVSAVMQHYSRQQGKSRWGVKTPSFVTEIDVLKQLFPAAKIIHLVRDGRDVAVSMSKIRWGKKNVIRAARDWREKVMMGRKMGNILGEDYLELRFEDLVADPAQHLQEVCEFLGEKFDPAMLDYHRSSRSAMPVDSQQWHQKSMSKPDTRKISSWKRNMSRSHQELFENEAGPWLRVFGYELTGRKPGLVAKLQRIYYQTIARY